MDGADSGYETSKDRAGRPYHCSSAQPSMQNTVTAFGSAGAGYKIPGESYSKAQGYIIKCKELAGSLVSSDWICEPFLILQKFKFLTFAPSQRR